MRSQTFVIVGASLAGASAAAPLRKQGFDGRIVLIGEEDRQPYERPDLSKKYLRGEPDAKLMVHEPGFYEEARIELIAGRAVDLIDSRRRQVVVGSDRIGFDRLLLATGASPRRLDIPGVELDGVMTLRTIDDADAIREWALNAESIVVVGGGWIGSEVAASLRQLERNVTLVTPMTVPLERVLGPEIGLVYHAAHLDHGVKVVTGVRMAAVMGSRRVRAIRTDDGQRIRADLVVIGAGAMPRTELAQTAGIAVDNGVLVDEHLETSVPGIFAAGDVANAMHPRYGRRLRVEHWDNAKRQGRAAAGNMLGKAKPYERIPYFYSDQYDLGMEYRGFAPRWDEVVIRGDQASGEFIAFWLLDGRVAAAMNVNIWDLGEDLDRLVSPGVRVDARRLADPTQPLTDLALAA
jgi:3-phenylpropionate/trans-cinnamate dioxygenase ferredoxin reductase subunit